FDEPAAAAVAGRLVRVLAAVAAGPAARPRQVPVLDEAERAQILQRWNDTAAPVAAAVACWQECLSYAGLQARADRLAAVLAAAGAGPEQVVAVMMERSPGLII